MKTTIKLNLPFCQKESFHQIHTVWDLVTNLCIRLSSRFEFKSDGKKKSPMHNSFNEQLEKLNSYTTF